MFFVNSIKHVKTNKLASSITWLSHLSISQNHKLFANLEVDAINLDVYLNIKKLNNFKII